MKSLMSLTILKDITRPGYKLNSTKSVILSKKRYFRSKIIFYKPSKKCLIETSRGKDEGITYLDVEEQPPLIDAPDRLLVSPGQTAELKEPFRFAR